MKREREKLYYSISEVADAAQVKPHVLRYWETQFRMLRPKKSRAGNRMYRPRDLNLVLTIRDLLYRNGYTIAGARRKLLDAKRARQLNDGLLVGAAEEPTQEPVTAVSDGSPELPTDQLTIHDSVRNRGLLEIKAALQSLLADLETPAPAASVTVDAGSGNGPR